MIVGDLCRNVFLTFFNCSWHQQEYFFAIMPPHMQHLQFTAAHTVISAGWINTLEQVTVDIFVSCRRFRSVPPCIAHCIVYVWMPATINTTAPIRSAGKSINFTIEIFTQHFYFFFVGPRDRFFNFTLQTAWTRSVERRRWKSSK